MSKAAPCNDFQNKEHEKFYETGSNKKNMKMFLAWI